MSEYIKQKYSKPRRQTEHPDYKPHPFRRPGPGPNETRKTEIDPDISLRVFNFASKTLPFASKIDWSDIQGVAISDSGDSGTIFIETEIGSVVVKGSPNIAIGTFFYNLAEILMIPVPKRRIVRFDEPEFKQITKELQRATFIHDDLHHRVRSRLDRPYLEVLEYIPGISLSEMGPQRACKILNSFDPKSRNRMIRLGMVYALDILINNCERLPLSLWNNVGDIDHLIVRTDPSFLDTTRELRDIENLNFEYEMIYSLDHRHTFFDELDPFVKQYQLSKYYVCVEEFLNQLFVEMVAVMRAQLDPLYETKEQKLESLMSFKKLVYTHTLYELKEMTILQVMIGLILALANISTLGIENIEILYNSIFQEVDYRNQWNTNLQRINLEYFASMVSIIRKFLGLHKDVVRWAKDITLNQYAYDPAILEEILIRSPIIKKQRLEEQLRHMQEQEQLIMMDEQDILDQPQGMINEANDEPVEDEDDGRDEILEQELDDDALNKRIMDMFDVDLTELAQNIKQDSSKIQKSEQQSPLITQKLSQIQESQRQSKSSRSQQSDDPLPQFWQPTYGGMLASQIDKNLK